MTHLVYGIDDKYLPCLIVSVFTALREIDGPAHVTVFTAGPEFDTSPIQVLARYYENAMVEIRPFDTSSLSAYEMTDSAARYPAASLLPLFLPWLVTGKCLFVDADTLICRDVAQLYSTDLNGCLIGACRSYTSALSTRRAFHTGHGIQGAFHRLVFKKQREKYIEKASRIGFTVQELETKFFSSGVILFDTDKIRISDPGRTLADMESGSGHWSFLPDMDRLNEFFKDKVHYFDLNWDVPRDVLSLNRLYASKEFWREIVFAIEDPGILHFSAIYRRKSWNRPWYKTRERYRLYRRTCQEICAQTGIDVVAMFNARE